MARIRRPPPVLRLRYAMRGSHVHCRLFIAPTLNATFAKVGELVFRIEEWDALRRRFRRTIDFVNEEECYTPAATGDRHG